MREMSKLFIIVVVFSVFSGGLLAALESATEERIAYQELKFVRGPVLKEVLEGCANDPLVDRFKLKDGNLERDFFVGIFDGKPTTVAFETSGKGFDADIGVMVAVNLKDDKIVGIGVTTHTETPGVGARVKTDPSFSKQFKGLSITQPFKVRTDGGNIDAISGATFSSRGVCAAVMAASDIYKRLKPKLTNTLKGFKA